MFYGLDERGQKILGATLGILGQLFSRVFHADNLIAVDRCLGFYSDPAFVEAFKRNAQTPQQQSLIWRLHTLTWATSQCRHLPGDFVECGVYRGFCASVVVDYLDFARMDRQFLLYDTFAGIPDQHREGSPVRAGGYEEPGLYEAAVERFSAHPNVEVVRGVVPEVFDGRAPDRVAFLHLDMNSASAEIGALEFLFDRMSPGAMIVLDDYGWQAYRAQKDAEDAFFGVRGYQVLELPTGQGLVVKR